jgi:hypothetical protein
MRVQRLLRNLGEVKCARGKKEYRAIELGKGKGEVGRGGFRKRGNWIGGFGKGATQREEEGRETEREWETLKHPRKGFCGNRGLVFQREVVVG